RDLILQLSKSSIYSTKPSLTSECVVNGGQDNTNVPLKNTDEIIIYTKFWRFIVVSGIKSTI
ncbi:hypothetical protein ACWY7G_004467, partial [Enterobacter hormaechei]